MDVDIIVEMLLLCFASYERKDKILQHNSLVINIYQFDDIPLSVLLRKLSTEF